MSLEPESGQKRTRTVSRMQFPSGQTTTFPEFPYTCIYIYVYIEREGEVDIKVCVYIEEPIRSIPTHLTLELRPCCVPDRSRPSEMALPCWSEHNLEKRHRPHSKNYTLTCIPKVTATKVMCVKLCVGALIEYALKCIYV